MNVYLNTETLRDALSRILSVIDKKNSRPILSYTLVDVQDECFCLTATDLEVSTKLKISCNADDCFSFCVNAKNIYDIIKELPSGEVCLRKNENNLEIMMQDIHYSLLIFENNDFPSLSFVNRNDEIPFKARVLSELINKTQHAISNDETRVYLNGIFVQEVDSKLRFVSTDGHRLALSESETVTTGLEGFNNGFIIPKKGVYELKKMVDSISADNIGLSVDDSFLYLNANDIYYLTIRLVAREYPKYQAVIPSKTAYCLKTDSHLFFDAVKRIKIMSNEKSNGIKISLSKNEMTILANNPSLGDATEKIPVVFDGTDMEIGFNAKYLLDSLSVLNTNDICLELNNELSPIIIKTPHDPDYLGIIMPLKIQ